MEERWIEIQVLRSDSQRDKKSWFQAYKVPIREGSTVLEVLLYIYENIDSSLGFRYGCRFKMCGLCAVEVDDKPRLSCFTKVNEGQRITPLKNLPLLKDLVFDRDPFFRLLSQYQPFVVRPQLPEIEPEPLIQPPEYTRLMTCRECFCCMATCPEYTYTDPSFGGPFAFIKLAQLFYDQRDSKDRVSQARELGIQRCRGCHKCYCPLGIPIYKDAIHPLLGS
jgi:succinate dehydrogenase/fumarate reductase iron-sulfur protein